MKRYIYKEKRYKAPPDTEPPVLVTITTDGHMQGKLTLMNTQMKRGETKYFGPPDGSNPRDRLYIAASTIIAISVT